MASSTDIEQIDAMRLGVDYSFVIKIRAFQLRVRPLSISENVQIAGEVAERLTDIPESLRNTLTQHTILAKETIKVASTSDVGANDPRITDYILDRMTADEVHSLFKQYVAACDRVNPSLERMKPEDLDNLIAALKKNARDQEALDSQLIELSHLQLHSLVASLLPKGD